MLKPICGHTQSLHLSLFHGTIQIKFTEHWKVTYHFHKLQKIRSPGDKPINLQINNISSGHNWHSTGSSQSTFSFLHVVSKSIHPENGSSTPDSKLKQISSKLAISEPGSHGHGSQNCLNLSEQWCNNRGGDAVGGPNIQLSTASSPSTN